MIYRVQTEWQNNANDWWDAARALAKSLRNPTFTRVLNRLLDTDDEVEIDQTDFEAFLATARELPGWEGGGTRAPYPLIWSEPEAQPRDPEQFARDYNWEDTEGAIDAEHAADQIMAELGSEDPAMRAALVASAERENARRYCDDDAEDPDRLIEPEPACEPGHTHDWRSPCSIVGGLDPDHPGVISSPGGGGVVTTEACMVCGCARVTDTWATDRATGEGGLVSIRYEEGRYSEALARRIRR